MRAGAVRSLVLLLAAFAAQVRAVDVGVPPEKRSVEVYYEHFSRNISQDYVSGIAVGDQEESRYLARYAQRVLPRLTLSATAGATHSDTAENYTPLVGLGVNVSAVRSSAANVDVFASGAYVHEIKYESAGTFERDETGRVIADDPAVDQTETYFELAGGIAISRDVKLGLKKTLTPYGGIMISKIAGEEEYELTFHEDGRTEHLSGDLRESGLASFFAGLALTLDGGWRLRCEGRFINQAGFSAGVSRSF